MKKSLVYVLLIFILSFFIAGCTELKQDKKLSESQIIQKENKKEEHNLSANYYYLESRIHIKNKDYKKAIVSLEKAMVNDPDSFILTRDLSQLYLNQNNEKKSIRARRKTGSTKP